VDTKRGDTRVSIPNANQTTGSISCAQLTRFVVSNVANLTMPSQENAESLRKIRTKHVSQNGENVPKKVLIAYGSRYGSTAEIARAMADALEKEGVDAQLLDLEQTKEKQWPSLASFDGLLVGSGIKIGRWTRQATKFLKTHADEIRTLKSKGLVVGVFVSCGLASTPGKHDEALQTYVEKSLNDVGIPGVVDVYDAFGGVYDLSPSSPMGFLDKRMLSMGAKQMSSDGVTVEQGERNDLRDWDQIRAFTENFAQLVLSTGNA